MMNSRFVAGERLNATNNTDRNTFVVDDYAIQTIREVNHPDQKQSCRHVHAVLTSQRDAWWNHFQPLSKK